MVGENLYTWVARAELISKKLTDLCDLLGAKHKFVQMSKQICRQGLRLDDCPTQSQEKEGSTTL